MAAGNETPIELPVDPTLAQAFASLHEAGHWVVAWDDQWRIVGVSDEILLTGSRIAIGEFMFGPVGVEVLLQGRTGTNSIAEQRDSFVQMGGWLLADIAGGRDAIREMVHPALRDLVDALEPRTDDAFWRDIPTTNFGSNIGSTTAYQRVRDSSGRIVGGMTISKPAVGMATNRHADRGR